MVLFYEVSKLLDNNLWGLNYTKNMWTSSNKELLTSPKVCYTKDTGRDVLFGLPGECIGSAPGDERAFAVTAEVSATTVPTEGRQPYLGSRAGGSRLIEGYFQPHLRQ